MLTGASGSIPQCNSDSPNRTHTCTHHRGRHLQILALLANVLHIKQFSMQMRPRCGREGHFWRGFPKTYRGDGDVTQPSPPQRRWRLRVIIDSFWRSRLMRWMAGGCLASSRTTSLGSMLPGSLGPATNRPAPSIAMPGCGGRGGEGGADGEDGERRRERAGGEGGMERDRSVTSLKLESHPPTPDNM